jgi:hypothetical protein
MLDELRKKWNRSTRFDPHVYRLEYRTALGRMRSEQMEKRWRAEALRKMQRKIPGVQDIRILKQKPDANQRFQRRILKRKTGYLEQMMGG